MAILDYRPQIWRDALDLPRDNEPVALILEGTCWRATATANRLSFPCYQYGMLYRMAVRFMDPLSTEDAARLNRSNVKVFEVQM